jgi:hypothetical protein
MAYGAQHTKHIKRNLSYDIESITKYKIRIKKPKYEELKPGQKKCKVSSQRERESMKSEKGRLICFQTKQDTIFIPNKGRFCLKIYLAISFTQHMGLY